MAKWSKDAISQAPKIIYIPLVENNGLTRVVYDPEAPADARLIATFSFLTIADETVDSLDAAFGI